MHILSQILLPILSLFTVIAVASTQAAASTADILYWPLTSAQPSLLARVSYDPTTLKSEVLSYSYSSLPVTAKPEEDVVRVGLYTSSPTDSKQKHWVGSLTSLSALVGEKEKGQTPTIRLHVGGKGEVYHVSVKTGSVEEAAAVAAKSGAGEGGDPAVVEVVAATTGPRPHLNRPVVVATPDGKGAEEVVEKTFFQK